MKTIKRNVYKGMDDPKPRIAFKDRNGVDLNLAPVIRLVLTVNPGGAQKAVVDTNTDIDSMPISGNQIAFDIGELAAVMAMPEGEYYVNLVAFDGAGEKSQLVHEADLRERLVFVISDTSA